jgi:hypothetical protein
MRRVRNQGRPDTPTLRTVKLHCEDIVRIMVLDEP